MHCRRRWLPVARRRGPLPTGGQESNDGRGGPNHESKNTKPAHRITYTTAILCKTPCTAKPYAAEGAVTLR